MHDVLIFLLGGLVLSPLVSLVARRFVIWRRGTKPLFTALKRFLGPELLQFPIVTRSFSRVDLPNIHLAIEKEAEARGARVRIIGYTSLGDFLGSGASLRDLLVKRVFTKTICLGPVEYKQVDIDVDRQMQCVQDGLHLIESPSGRLVAHIHSQRIVQGLALEVLGPSKETCAGFIEAVHEKMKSANVFRGKVVSLERDAEARGGRAPAQVKFHRLPPVREEEIILPAATKSLIERNTVGFYRHTGRLRSSGCSVRRGILLHGKPGTGKTFTARWLAGSLPGVTVILLSGEQLGLVKECCHLAQLLAPSLVILEDVDLIAISREQMASPTFQMTLHQLLNEMDGVGGDLDIIFLLTTNRPEAIEAALAARPGRVDQAIELPLPDAECRRRLIELYGGGMSLAIADMDRLISKVEGASPAFIKELMRKAALIASEEDGKENGVLRVTDAHCDAALQEVVLGGRELTRNLLGFGSFTDGKQGPANPGPGGGSLR